MGERRWRASRDLGLPTIPAIVRDTADDAMLRDALLENLHRAQLNPLEEAAAYRQLLDEFGATHEELAGRIGRSRSQVTNTIRLLNLPVPVQRRVAAGVLSAGHARALLTLDDADAQDALATRIVAEGLSVRAVEELVALGGAREAGRQPDRAAAPGDRAGADRPGRPALRQLRHPGQGRARPAQGQDRGRVRLGRRPGAHCRADGAGDRPASERSRRPRQSEPGGTSSRCPRRTCTSTWRARSGRPRWRSWARSRRSRPRSRASGRSPTTTRPSGACCGRPPSSSGSRRVLCGLGRRRRPVRGADVHRGRAREPARRFCPAAGGSAGRAARGDRGRPGSRSGCSSTTRGGGRRPGPRRRCGWRSRTRISSSGSGSPGTRPHHSGRTRS